MPHFICSLWVALCLWATVSAYAGPNRSKAEKPPSGPPTPTYTDFENDDLPTVLRVLARQAKISVIIDGNVSGLVTMRLQDVTSLRAIEIIAQAKKLQIKHSDGVYRITSPESKPLTNQAREKTPDAAIAEALVPTFGTALIKLADISLEYLAQAETTTKMARYKRNFYDALIKEGFTKEEALKILLADRPDWVPAVPEK